MLSLERLSKRFRTAGANGRLDLSFFWRASEEHTRYDRGPKIYGGPWRVTLLVGEAQLAGCLKYWVSGPLAGTQASSDYVQGIVQDTVDEASVSIVTPDWCTVLSC